ncbi:helix-turn-helix domain-containing protein [Alginatibacterium sediminis]|uniref:Helix-turn-helix domain-containing protein n=1 Tax=Alginatibacterium sediminis TaxID=2164068 RepID=A0A420EIF8_9ALTE|nr:helix-turn-helix domain-containing protein [Alginatibacterium sediminis]
MFAPGRVVAYGQSIDAQAHKHPLWQLCLPSQASQLNQKPINGAVVIKPNQTHQLNMPKGWIILAEPQSVLGQVIAEISIEIPRFKPCEDDSDLNQVLSAYPSLVYALNNNDYQARDDRLRALLENLDQCLAGECLKPDSWRAKQVAEAMFLSESRFLHLFRAQLGIAWRPYLLWKRLICALLAIKRGQSATQAAYQAGFSDSAHLSHTLSRNLGMTSKQLLLSFKDS